MSISDFDLSPDFALKYKEQVYQSPLELQKHVLKDLISTAKNTKFGHDHQFNEISSMDEFKSNVPIREYNELKPYIDLILAGKQDVLWPGQPIFLANTSASTGYPKVIPVTKDSIVAFINLPLRTMLQYMLDTKDFSLLTRNTMNLTSDLVMTASDRFMTGSLSGFCREMLPPHLLAKSLPSKETLALMSSNDWDTMFRAAAKEAIANDVSVCTGFPTWMMQLFNACKQITNQNNLTSIFPNLKLICSSGVSLKPYRSQIQKLFSHKVDFREFYGASEGALAYQDTSHDTSMLLNVGDGVYFEFIELKDCHKANAKRFNLSEVEVGVDYVPVISTNAGLWAYKMGDIISFTSTAPYKIIVVGRTAHYISVARESVYSKNVEDAMTDICTELGLVIENFTVTPGMQSSNKPCYEWYIETREQAHIVKNELAFKLDYYLKQTSMEYKLLREKGQISSAKVHLLKPGAFIEYLKQKDTSSLQLKVPKVQNDRNIADFLRTHDLIITEKEFV